MNEGKEVWIPSYKDLLCRAIGQSDMTREYIYSLEEPPYKMPKGPIFLQVESVFGAFKTEVLLFIKFRVLKLSPIYYFPGD